jgi:hypothetical protein
MHKHNKGYWITLKYGVNDPGLAFTSRAGLGPFWTLVQVLLYRDVVYVSVSSSVAQAYGYRREDLHEDANARFN